MSIEPELIALLQTLCPRVLEKVAPLGTPLPRLVIQHIGGKTARFLNNTPAPKRNISFQIASWAATSAQAFALARQIEEALCASATLTIIPQGEPIDGIADGDEAVCGAVQTFSIWGAR